MPSLRSPRRAVALVSMLWILLASVRVVGGCENAWPDVGAAVSVAAEASGPAEACACLCACGCLGAAVALLPAVPVGEETRLVRPRQAVLAVTPPTVASAAPPTEPPRG